MKIATHTPHPMLREFIEAFVVLELEAGEVVKDFYPTNAALMCFDITQEHFCFADDTFHFTDTSNTVSLCFVGVLDRYFPVKRVPQKILQVVFNPIGAYRFFDIEMSAFTNMGTAAQLVQFDIRDTIARMEDCYPDEFKCMALLQTYFIERLRKNTLCHNATKIHFACNEIIKQAGNVRIQKLCKDLNMSESRFRVHFNEKVGISPKAFCRIEKLKQISHTLARTKSKDWMEFCEGYNFFDQAHFIKEFKTYFGCTPTEFLRK